MKRIVIFICVFASMFGVSTISSRAVLPPSQERKALALVGAKIYPSPADKPIPNGVVLINDGKITAVGEKGVVNIPAGTRIIDCAGLSITAGFWNSHVHFMERKWENAASIPASELTEQLRDMLTRYGFTTVFDTGSQLENTKIIRQRIESGEADGPKIFSTGEILFPKGGLPDKNLIIAFGFIPSPMPEIKDAQQAIEIVKQETDNGADAIKIYASTWGFTRADMPVDEVSAIASEAHRRGKLLFAHPSNANGIKAAVEGGADVLVHTAPDSGKWSPALINQLKQKNIALIPTLKLWKYETRHARASLVEGWVNTAIEQLKDYSQAGGAILFGTDVGYMDDYDTAEEFKMMERAGMSFRDILSSLTIAPAKKFGRSKEVGAVAAGMNADIVALIGDPASDITAFSKIKYTVRNGKLIYESK